METLSLNFSESLRIDRLPAPGGGIIGICRCPGAGPAPSCLPGRYWDLIRDLEAIWRWNAVAVVTLMESYELQACGVPQLGLAVRAAGMAWHHLPVHEGGTPNLLFERLWAAAGDDLRRSLMRGQRILLHGHGSLGRAGTIAARLLVELGTPPALAIRQVRLARLGAIVTEAQAQHVAGVRALDPAAFGGVTRRADAGLPLAR